MWFIINYPLYLVLACFLFYPNRTFAATECQYDKTKIQSPESAFTKKELLEISQLKQPTNNPAQKVCKLIVKKIPELQNTFIVIFVIEGKNVDDIYRVIIVSNINKKAHLLATSRFDIARSGPEWKIDSFDFADYKVSESEKAFGIRVSESNPGKTRSYIEERLFLFLLQDQKLNLIFDTTIQIESFDTDDASIGTDSATLHVLKSKSQNKFEWEKRSGKKKALIKWENGTYKLQGIDPLPKE